MKIKYITFVSYLLVAKTFVKCGGFVHFDYYIGVSVSNLVYLPV